MNLSSVIKVLFGVILLVFLLFFVGVEEVAASVVTMNPVPLLAALLFIPVHIFLKFIRWREITLTTVKVPTKDLFKIFMIGFFFASITPSKIGDIIKFRYLKKYNTSTETALSLTLIDRLFDIFVIFLISIIGLFVIPELIVLSLWQSLLIIAVVVIVSSYIILKENVFIRLLKFFVNKTSIAKKLKKDSNELAKNIYSPFAALKKKPTVSPSLIIITVLVWMTASFQSLLIFSSLGIEVSLLYMFIFTCMGAVIGLIPITISGIGTRDGVFILLFSLISIGSQNVIIMSLLTLFITQIIPSIFGFFIYVSNKK